MDAAVPHATAHRAPCGPRSSEGGAREGLPSAVDSDPTVESISRDSSTPPPSEIAGTARMRSRFVMATAALQNARTAERRRRPGGRQHAWCFGTVPFTPHAAFQNAHDVLDTAPSAPPTDTRSASAHRDTTTGGTDEPSDPHRCVRAFGSPPWLAPGQSPRAHTHMGLRAGPMAAARRGEARDGVRPLGGRRADRLVVRRPSAHPSLPHSRVSTPDASCGERAGAGMEAGWWTRWRPPHPSPTYADGIQQRDPRCREGIRRGARRHGVEQARCRMPVAHSRCYGEANGEGLVGVLTPTPTTLTPAPTPALLLPLPLRRLKTRTKRGYRLRG